MLIITLNVNGLNAPTKRQRLPEWIQKQDWYICYLQETLVRARETYRLKVWEWYSTQIEIKKKAGEGMICSEKVDFKTKTVIRDKEGPYTIIKGSIPEKYITIINVYRTNLGAPEYVRQIQITIKEEIDSNTIIVGALTPLFPQWTDNAYRKLIRKQRLSIPIHFRSVGLN